MKSVKKYFVIGFNKTATSTFHHIFKINGLKSQHAKSNHWKTNVYDCFSDITAGDDIWKKCYSKYPKAIFILNVRSLDKWLISRFKHGLARKNKPNWAYPYTSDKCKQWIKDRESIHRKILDFYTKDPKKLIIVDIEKPGWEKFICSEFGFKNNKIVAKNVRKTNTQHQHHINIINLVNTTLTNLGVDKTTKIISDNDALDKYLQIYKNYT